MSTLVSPPTQLAPTTVEEVQAAVQSASKVMPTGAGTKPALYGQASDAVRLDLRKLTGILEYEPGEYTFTARAGTPLAEIVAALTEHGQYLPFDPPFIDAGATLGGTIAAGLSGSGRFRFGGLRDFLIGVRMVDGRGTLVRGGGKVVKNAAGFDLPKLMIGSMGRLGVLVEASFKVFPAPPALAGWQAEFDTLDAALEALHKLLATNLDLDVLDLTVDATDTLRLAAQVGGPQDALAARVQRIIDLVGGEEAPGDAIAAQQRERSAFAWVQPDSSLVKVPTTVHDIPKLEADLAGSGAARRYIAGGVQAWIGWPGAVADLDLILQQHSLSGLVLRGATTQPLIGKPVASAFRTRLRAALDPEHRFLEYDA